MAKWASTEYQGDIEDTTETLAYILGDERARYGPAEYELLERSYTTARDIHGRQKRASGEPYIVHCIEVARILTDWRLDPATVCAALLHDVIEDSAITRDQLAQQFPTPIPELVDGVTKISRLNLAAGQDQQIESLRKLILAMSDDVRVTLIKLADRLHNMRTLEHLSASQQERIAQVTLDIYAPLAHRLGMMTVRSELEDLSMRYLWPDEYRRIAGLIAQKREHREQIVRLTVDYLRKRLKEAHIDAQIEGRSKHLYSVFHKMRSQGLEFDELYDLIAVRVICNTVDECYDILGHVHQIFPPIAGRFKDYIAMPKENMYQSLHTAVVGLRGQVTEIQIRTRQMHQVAEYGVAAHWKYKEGAVAGKTTVDPKLLWLRRLTEWLTDVRDPQEFMAALRNEAFSETILVFTPRGDVVELPAGSTPLDFAYAIHTDVGSHCDGAKVNHRVVPLKTTLQNGDLVEIITRKSATPSVGWLDIVKTSRARGKIRHYLRTQNRDVNIQRGREALQRAIKGHSINLSWADIVKRIEENLASFRAHSVDELLSEIGFGAIKPVSIVNRLFPPRKKHARRPEEAMAAAGAEGGESQLERPTPRRPERRKKSTGGVIIEGIDENVVHFAKCCFPLPGDPIVGFITVGRGVTIHKSSCGNLRKSLAANPENQQRILSAQWDDVNLPVRATEIRLALTDRRGLLADVCNLITARDGFIVSSNSRSTKDGRALMRFVVEVKDKQHLEDLLSHLRSQPDVISISP